MLIYCLIFFPLFVGVMCLSLFCYTLLCVHSCFAIILKRKRKLVALILLSYRCIAGFIGFPYFSGFKSGLKLHVLISHDYLSQSKFVPLPRDRAAMCSRPASKYYRKFYFVSKQACLLMRW